MRSLIAVTFLVLACSSAHGDSSTRPIDYLDADFAARCSALHIALSTRLPDESKEAKNNMFQATLFGMHKKVTDDQIRRLMPWAMNYLENDPKAVIELAYCGEVLDAVAAVWNELMRE